MEPSAFLFFFRVVFRQLHTYTIMGKGSPSLLQEAMASFSPQPPPQEGLASPPRIAASQSAVVPAHLPPHMASPSLPF